MAGKRYTAEEIIHKLREAEVLLAEACKQLGISRNSVRYEPQPRPDEAALTGSVT